MSSLLKLLKLYNKLGASFGWILSVLILQQLTGRKVLLQLEL